MAGRIGLDVDLIPMRHTGKEWSISLRPILGSPQFLKTAKVPDKNIALDHIL